MCPEAEARTTIATDNNIMVSQTMYLNSGDRCGPQVTCEDYNRVTRLILLYNPRLWQIAEDSMTSQLSQLTWRPVEPLSRHPMRFQNILSFYKYHIISLFLSEHQYWDLFPHCPCYRHLQTLLPCQVPCKHIQGGNQLVTKSTAQLWPHFEAWWLFEPSGGSPDVVHLYISAHLKYL